MQTKALHVPAAAVTLAVAIMIAAHAAEDAPANAAGITADHPNQPDGYRLVATLDCGAETVSSEDSPAIRVVQGEPFTFSNIEGSLGTAAYHEDRVICTVEELDPAKAYVLGFTWWDADQSGRKQSVALGAGEGGAWQMVLPPTVPAAFDRDKPTYARVLLPLPESLVAEGSFRIAFVTEGGPNAVVSELWLLEAAATDKKRVLIVTGDDYPGHVWRETAPELAEILREDARFEVSITESPAILGSPLLDQYDALVLHFKDYAERLLLGEPVWSGLQRYVDNGGGVVVAHFGCGAFQEWPGFVDVVGRVWNPELRGHDPYGSFEVRVVDDAHAITRGFASFRTEDELYTCLEGETPIHVLCEATSVVDQKVYPMGFVVEGKRVFHTPLGHDVNAFQAEGARELYRRGVAWAAGL